jgi:hypothetical protein
MTKLIYSTILLLVFVLIPGCQDQTGVVNSPLNEQEGENILAKQTILTQIEVIVPFGGTRFIPCINGGAGEDVAITGTAEFKLVEFLDENGGFHGRASVRTLEYGGVGQVTGDIYEGVGGKERQNIYIGPTGLPYSTNFTANYNYHGPSNNFREKVRVTLVYNANGELTANFYTESIDCN